MDVKLRENTGKICILLTGVNLFILIIICIQVITLCLKKLAVLWVLVITNIIMDFKVYQRVPFFVFLVFNA